ncbi:MAG: Rne/Rng family ribonuclease [Proteobacteria bacterium]|nr:Rne/Rng family ribonuclease [Pseudomonadota bacterium]MBU1386797.1 Rne/Rng family ribonuclease [Pseudomonadota bacterium]MBU1544741.1 Rne/Rng family ribonuclease [Pseudomonadota bacterium]MBU2431454.1 Rne/Rng family ribonuclease [Pseudomonadota bacterium]MBU2481910.1 Rne/Rng family ribonuclease [Pseudomonadota bacterium]
MLKELVVNAAPHETRVALLENGTIVEVFIEREDETSIAGNIYKGRVQRVLPGMQAAFVDIGFDQAAFIYVDDVLDTASHKMYQKFEQDTDTDTNGIGNDMDAETAAEKQVSWRAAVAPECGIEDLLTEGQEVLVQVAKSSIGSKGPRVTTHISLAGRYMVLMPTVDHIGISRRIEDEAERLRLKEMLLSLRKNNFGYILRTRAQGIDKDTIEKEIDFLTKTWEDISARSKTVSATSLVYKDLTVTFRAVRDLLANEADKLIIDSKEEYEHVQNFLNKLMPDVKLSVELYQGKESIFDAYNIEGDIARALKKKVWLKSGGYIVIDQTEALVAIDVNTGRYVGKHNFDETILKTNLEAVKEIAYQIRLRNIGGIIIIDFIDMKKEQHKDKVMAHLNEAMKKDKSQTNILPLTELGLVQMTRKRIRRNLSRTLCEPCFYCNGDGHLLSRKSICHKIYRDLLSEASDMMGNRFTVKVHPEIAQLLHGQEKHLISSLEKQFSKPIAVYPEPHYHMEEYHIFESVLKE